MATAEWAFANLGAFSRMADTIHRFNTLDRMLAAEYRPLPRPLVGDAALASEKPPAWCPMPAPESENGRV